MAKGGKNQQQQQKKRKPQPESQSEEQEQQPLEQQQQQEQEQIDYLDPELSDRDEQLLQRINSEILETTEPLKFTWAAIHKLKNEEKSLNEKMEQEMVNIQRKYDQMKVPIWQRISKVVTGQVLEKELYTQHQMTKGLNINKHKPEAIPGFWKRTLQSVGFVQSQSDEALLQSCTKLQCHTKHSSAECPDEDIKIKFTFGQNDIISNKQLSIQVRKKGQENLTKNVSKINYKSKDQASQESIFSRIFNPETPAEDLYIICQDLQRAYNNCVFYYFYQGKLDDELQGEEGVEGQDEDNEQQENEDDEDQPPKRSQPNKKNNTKGGKKSQQKPLEKPQCKNQ